MEGQKGYLQIAIRHGQRPEPLRVLPAILRTVEDQLEEKRQSQARWRIRGLGGKEVAMPGETVLCSQQVE